MNRSPWERRHPELEPIFSWKGFPAQSTVTTRRRVIVAEVYWALRIWGPISHRTSAVRLLAERLVEKDATGADLSLQVLTNMMRPLCGDGGPLANDYPRLIERHVTGKHTNYLAALLDVEAPPNPFELRPMTPPRGLDKVKALMNGGPSLKPTPAPVVESLRLELPGPDPVVMAPVPAEPVLPEPAPVGELVPAPVGADASAAEKALVVMRLAGELYQDALVRSSTTAPAGDPDQAERLAAALEEAARLRARLDKALQAAELARASQQATEAVLAGERRRREMAEANLAAIAKGDRPANDSGFKALNGMMRETPRVR